MPPAASSAICQEQAEEDGAWPRQPVAVEKTVLLGASEIVTSMPALDQEERMAWATASPEADPAATSILKLILAPAGTPGPQSPFARPGRTHTSVPPGWMAQPWPRRRATAFLGL